MLFAAILLLGCDQLEIRNNKEPIQKATEQNSDGSAGEKSNPPQEKPEDIKRIESSELESEIKINVKGADPEKYAIQFSWPYLVDEKVLRIRLGSVLAEVLPNQTFFTHILPHNQTVTFSFDVLDKSRKPERTFTKTVRIPTDFVLTAANNQFKENTKIDVTRIFLNESLPLTTNGYTVDILAEEIHTNNGSVQTFPEFKTIKNESSGSDEQVPFQASIGKIGRSGGNISITSKKLFGPLKIYMRGELGGDGPRGQSFEQRKDGVGTPAGNGKNVCEYNEYGPTQCICQYGSRGGNGAPGSKGNPGAAGMPGGDSGNIRVSIHQYVPLEGFDPTLPREGGEVVRVFQVPGTGGKGGPGGDGQRGSPGGPGRDPNNMEDCRGESGDEGPKGADGDEGPTGIPGKLGLKCVYVGSENVNECTQ
jgi:hypothetical protein